MKTIHISQAGFALCGFMSAIPRDWPEGHYWVGIGDRQDANCNACIRRALDLIERPQS